MFHVEEDLLTVNFSHVVKRRKLIARFQPQQWIFDNAIDCEMPVDVDVTKTYLELSIEDRAKIRDNRDTSDALVLNATDIWQKHGGPGYVTVEEAIVEFHA